MFTAFTDKILSKNLQKRTDNILSVFSKTVDQLSAINQEAHAQIETNKAVITELVNENTSLQTLTEQNNKIANNIKALLK